MVLDKQYIAKFNRTSFFQKCDQKAVDFEFVKLFLSQKKKYSVEITTPFSGRLRPHLLSFLSGAFLPKNGWSLPSKFHGLGFSGFIGTYSHWFGYLYHHIMLFNIFKPYFRTTNQNQTNCAVHNLLQHYIIHYLFSIQFNEF